MKMNLLNKPLLVTPQQLEKTLYHPYPPTVIPRAATTKLQIIPVEGLLLHRFDGLGTSYESIREQLKQALHSSNVEHIVLEIDSGGGEVNGLFDLVDDLIDARKIKPITALVNEAAFSAAYLIASTANQIIVPRTGMVGSIGVMVAHCDQSEAEKRMGLKFTEIFAGSHKVDFSPHQALSDEATSRLQSQVNETYEMFIQTLERNRNMPGSIFRDTAAQIYTSEKALSLQLIDKIGSPHKMIEELIMTEDVIEQKSEFNPNQLLTTERERIKNIMNLCKLAKKVDCLEKMIETGATVEEARIILFDQLVAQTAEPTINALNQQSSQSNMLNFMVQGLKGA